MVIDVSSVIQLRNLLRFIISTKMTDLNLHTQKRTDTTHNVSFSFVRVVMEKSTLVVAHHSIKQSKSPSRNGSGS